MTDPTPFARRAYLRRICRRSLYEGMFSVPLCYITLPGNLVLIALCSSLLKLEPAAFGLMMSIPFACNFLQLLFTPWLGLLFRYREQYLVGLWVHSFFLSAFSLWLWTRPDSPGALSLPVVTAFIFCSCLSQSVGGVAWTIWIQNWIPPRISGRYFSLRNQAGQCANLAFLLLVGAVLLHPTKGAFALLIAGSVALRLVAGFIGHSMNMSGQPATTTRAALPAQLSELGRNPAVWRFLLFGAGWGFALNFFSTFQPLIMLESLSRNTLEATLPLALSLLFGALALPTWGRLIDRFGSKPLLVCGLLLWVTGNLPWIFITPQTRWLLYPVWAFTGALNAGITLAQFNLTVRLVPSSVRSLAIGLNTAMTALFTALAPILAGQLISTALAAGWPRSQVYHGFFLLLPVIGLGPLLLLHGLREPRASTVQSAVGALGLGFLLSDRLNLRSTRK